MVVHLAAGDGRRVLVEEAHDVSDQPGLGLSALAQEDQVVAGQDAALQCRQHRSVEPDDRGEQLLPPAQRGQEVGSELLLHGAVGIAAGAELADRGRKGHGEQGIVRPAKRPARPLQDDAADVALELPLGAPATDLGGQH